VAVCLSSPHFSGGVRLARVRVRESEPRPRMRDPTAGTG
jgi:hypothetical protein